MSILNTWRRGEFHEAIKKIPACLDCTCIWHFLFMGFSISRTAQCKSSYHSLKLDDMIPFCEYFIIPYLMWFLYFAFINKNKQEYYQLIFTLGLGMTLFLVVSYFYPNGQDLRPHLTGDGFFISLVRHLYRIDTPTNILPSIHVFNSVACCIAICRHNSFKHPRTVKIVTFVLSVLIILATVFLKQHTLIDVFSAFALNIVAYQMFYKPHPVRQKQPEQIFLK